MQLAKDVLTAIGVSAAIADKYLNEAMGKHGIDTPLRIAHFLAQVGHESGLFSTVSENLNYRTADRLLAVFGRRFRSRADAEAYAGKPEKIGIMHQTHTAIFSMTWARFSG